MIDEIEVLRKLEAFRVTHQNSKESPADWCMRVMQAIVAKEANISNRNEWTDKIK